MCTGSMTVNHSHNVESTASRSWLAVPQALDETGKQEGFQHCDWSRVLEKPSHIYIWMSWVDMSAYDAEVGKKIHRLLYETLESLSTYEVNTKVIQYDQVESYAVRKLRKRWPSITVLRFSETLSQE
jgi:quinol monooxygenase YgiN